MIIKTIISSNIYPYFTSSGPLTSFTILAVLFLVSTVTLGKPLRSVKKKMKPKPISLNFNKIRNINSTHERNK